MTLESLEAVRDRKWWSETWAKALGGIISGLGLGAILWTLALARDLSAATRKIYTQVPQHELAINGGELVLPDGTKLKVPGLVAEVKAIRERQLKESAQQTLLGEFLAEWKTQKAQKRRRSTE